MKEYSPSRIKIWRRIKEGRFLDLQGRRRTVRRRRPDCVVEPDKITKYLLNLEHQIGGPKAKFFLAGGFSLDNPNELARALKKHFRDNKPTERKRDQFGDERLIFKAPMKMPDGRTPMVVSVWKVEDRNPPRLITAYPE